MNGQIVFDPLLPWAAIAILAALALLGTGLALWRGLSGWALRALAGLVLVGALAQPSYQVEDRAPLSDIVLMLVDTSASQLRGTGTVRFPAERLDMRLTGAPKGDGLLRLPGAAFLTALHQSVVTALIHTWDKAHPWRIEVWEPHHPPRDWPYRKARCRPS